MKIETVALEDQQTRLTVEFEADTLEKYKRQAARKISQNQKIPGFRPGKAPFDLVRRIVGDEALQQEAVELMLDEVYPQVLKEANITPGGPGKLDEIVKLDPPTFAFIVPMPPAVDLGDYKSVRKEYSPEPITDEQVETTLRNLQRNYATAEPVERAAEKGDMVSFKISAKRTQVEEGETDTLIEETPYQLVAGEAEDNQENAWPYDGFENELIGLSTGDTKTVVHTFSDESPYEDLRGKEAEFKIEVQGVKEMHLPEMNDEFAQMLGEFTSLDELRTAVRGQLEQQYSQQYDQDYYEGVIGSLVEQATIKYPPNLLDEEIEDFLSGLEKNLERDRLDLETYLKMRQMDRQAFIDSEVKPAATRRLERSLVLEEFARAENVQLGNDEIRAIYNMAMQQVQSSPEQQKALKKNRQNASELANSVAMNTVNSIFNQRMMSRLRAIATGQGDEVAEPVAEAALETVEAEAVDPISGEASAVMSDQAAEEEQAAAEAELSSDEPAQAEAGEEQASGDSEATEQ